MTITNSIIDNVTVVHKQAKSPVLKVQGFDGYNFEELGVTDQFLENASVYYEKYTNPQHFRALYNIALEVIQPTGKELTILDIGTGGGNSIFALIELLGADRVKALGVDISPQLLELCSKVADETYQIEPGRLDLLCADLYDVSVKSESVDLVSGSSILHHMLDPAPIVRLALAALKPGGTAIFTEPFEDGHGVLMNAYRLALSLEPGQPEPIPENLKNYMQLIIRDFDARKGVGNVRDYTRYLDDKWYFTRGWFEDIAREMGCDLRLLPTHANNETKFQDAFRVLAHLNNGADSRDAPEWVQAIIRSLDENFSVVQKRDFFFTGIVLMSKRGR